MEIIICKTTEAAVALTARLVNDQVAAKPNSVLGLATGRTMEAVYNKMVAFSKEDGLSYKGITSFNLDEYVGLDGSSVNSYRYYMNEHLFDKIDADKSKTHVPNGVAEDLDAACAQYEKDIVDAGGIDVQLLGIGRTGHIGFNDPLSSLGSRTRPKSLDPVTIEQNSPLFKGGETMPTRAVTMGVQTILDARRTILLATGAEKAEIIAKATEGPITSMISASALQLHPSCVVIVDEAAATKLQGTDYYNWVFQNEPEWAPYRNLVG